MNRALYRKYRPTRLQDVIGQDHIIQNLDNSLVSHKISHAYLFTGPRGTGKTSIARIFAHAINDFPYTIEDSYLDIIEIDAASNTGVDNIRELREKAIIAPSESKYKVYIIDEVHMLSKSAFNALLKTLEEPPAHVVFIMATTDIHKVPITITSRSQVYTFKLADADTMLDYLKTIAKKEKIAIASEALKIIVRHGGGSFRDSISLLDQISSLSDQKITADQVISALGLPQDQTIEELLKAYTSGDQEQVFIILKELLSSGSKPETLAEVIINHIISTPDPQLIPLLKQLPAVTNPFPEAKLLLAFTSPNTQITPTVSTSTTTQKSPKTVVKKTEPTPAKFSWETFISAVENQDSNLAKTLARDTTYELSEKTLYLQPRNKFIYNRLDKNKPILKPLLLDIKLVIKEPTSSKKDSPNAKISDIMGGEVEEVQVDGGEIPF